MPRDLFGLNISTFQVILMLLKLFPKWFVDKLIVLFSRLTLGSTDKYGLIRPKEGPLEMKARTGHTPVLDVGTVAKVKSGEIKVQSCTIYCSPHKLGLYLLLTAKSLMPFDPGGASD